MVNLTDLFVVTVLASGIYGLIVALSGRKHFLEFGVNPYRGAWLLAAASCVSFGRGLLWWEAHNSDTSTLDLLRMLVSDEKTPLRVKIASVAAILGIVLAMLVVWCVRNLPRDPSTYRRPEDRQKAMRYYVVSLKGGLDYGILCDGDGQQLIESVDEKQVGKRLEYLPRVSAGEGQAMQPRTAAQQIGYWREAAKVLHQRMQTLDEIIAPAHQGRNRRILFDAQYGGFYFIYLRLSDPRDGQADCLYLFGATLNQSQINDKVADHHFDLLVGAMRNIYRSIGLEQ